MLSQMPRPPIYATPTYIHMARSLELLNACCITVETHRPKCLKTQLESHITTIKKALY